MTIRKALQSTALSLSLVALAASTAHAEFDVAGMLGAHFYGSNNELGRYTNGPNNLAPQHGGMVGLRLSWFPWEWVGFEGEIAYDPTYIRGGNKAFENILHYRGQLRVNVWHGRWRPFVVLGGGAASMWTAKQTLVINDTDPYIHGGVGVEYDIRPNWGVRLDGRILFVPSVGSAYFTEDYEVLASIYGRFDLKKPPAPPAAPLDTDKDGIPDVLDRCPEKPGPKENQGCPDLDSDGDGIIDRLDKCWDVPGIPENEGCPDKDSDGDGLLDREDHCPTVPGPKANNGCPDLDTDGDGIVDRLDKCPTEPETKNAYQDEDGCPDEIPIEIKKFTGVIRGINFKTDSAEIVKTSFPLLDEAAKVLADHPEIKLEISGHTDSSGSVDHNVHLSETRANSVRDYFIKKGIDASRLRALGFGPSRPIEDNTTKAGRAKNRRVEFKLIE